jgi:hypothetical protein
MVYLEIFHLEDAPQAGSWDWRGYRFPQANPQARLGGSLAIHKLDRDPRGHPQGEFHSRADFVRQSILFYLYTDHSLLYS